MGATTERRRIAAGVLAAAVLPALGVLAMLVAGCAPRTFEVLADGGARVDPLPVTVDDQTGKVAGVVAVDRMGRAGIPQGISNPPDRQDILRLSWMGGLCDERTTLTLAPSGEGYRITNATTASRRDCELAGITRAIVIELRAPIPADTVAWEEDPPPRPADG